MADEIARNEHWVGNDDLIKEHIDALISTNEPARHWDWHGLTGPSPLATHFNGRFVEIVYNVENEDDGVTAKRTTKKTIITYALIGHI